MSLDIPAGWQEALGEIVATGGVCLVCGRVDAGKTTFCGVLAARALEAGVKVALVDADPGQSDIGPPAAVGMAVVTGGVGQELASCPGALESIPADALSFVGTTSPGGHLLQLAAATYEMVAHARAAHAQLIIVDTTGLVDAGIGRALKAAKVNLLRPRQIAALQKGDEIEHLLAPYRKRDEPLVRRLRVSRRAKARERDERKAKRERQFAAYFAAAARREIGWDDVGLEQTAWLTGEPVPGHVAAYVEETVGAEALYAERIETGLFAIVKRLSGAAPAWGAAHRTIKGEEQDVRAVDSGLLENLLLGLIDGSGHTLALGILCAIDFKQRRFVICTPLASMERVRALRLGSMRVSPDGAELGHGEIA